FAATLGGAPANSRWENAAGAATTPTVSSGGGTINVNYYKQWTNTFQFSTNGNGPPTWDSGLSIAPTGTSLGVAGTVICTANPTSGTTTTATCSGYADNGAVVTSPSLASGAAANIQWKLYGTSTYTPTSGGNTVTAFTYYKQVGNKYEITDVNSGTTFDTGLTALTITGTVGGTAGSTLCTITASGATSPAVCSVNPAYSNYNTAVNGFTNPLGGAGANSRWQASATCSFTPTTGGNTENCNYYKQWTNTFTFSPTAPTTWDAAFTGTATGTYFGTAGSTICTATLTSGGGAASCSAYSDNGATVTFATISDGTNGRWQPTAASSPTAAITSGGATKTGSYYRQLQNTYQATPSSPATWDAVFSIPVTGTYTGTAGSTICTIATTSGGGAASCTGWADYNTAVSLPASVADGTNTQWTGKAPLSFTQTTGGNTNNVNYYKQLQNTYQATPTTNGNKWDAALSIPVTGSILGVTGQTGCTIATTSGGGAASCSAYFDYNTLVTVTSPVTVSSREQWAASTANTFTQTTGGNTNNVNYVIHLTTAVTKVQQVAGASKTTQSFTCAYGTNPTAGDLLTVAFTYYPSTLTVSTVTDTLGSAFAQIGTKTTASTAATSSYIYAATVPTTGADTITVKLSGTPTAAFVTCIEWSGVTSVTPVTAPTNAGTGTASPLAASVASFTPNSNDVIYAYAGFTSCASTGTITYMSGYTAGTAKGTDASTGSTCGGANNFELNEADELVLAWTSGSTTSTFSVAMGSAPTGGRTSGWAEIAVEFDPPSASSSPLPTNLGRPDGMAYGPAPSSPRLSSSSPETLAAVGPGIPLVSFAAALSMSTTASESRPRSTGQPGKARRRLSQGISSTVVADLASCVALVSAAPRTFLDFVMDSELGRFKRDSGGPSA
ncbi:MAG: beta strand repeat-containing protein, partial [Nitrososphaerales archaeon]